MTQQLSDVSEAEATGAIAEIYAEVRALYGVPYVSAIHRILAGRPGFLEWAWASAAPAFRNGAAQAAGWRCAEGLPVAPLDTIPEAALRLWGIGADGEDQIAAVCRSFVHVAPINMIFAAVLTRLLEGESAGMDDRGRSQESHGDRSWTPPTAPSVPLPPLIDLPTADDSLQHVSARFATDLDGKPFVPGLYRMLAHWPGLLAHLSVVLPPRLAEPATRQAYDTLRARIDAAAVEVLAAVPAPERPLPLPPETDRAWFLDVTKTYRRTSPEMVVAGRLIGDAISSGSRRR